jgi:hypothetical protein
MSSVLNREGLLQKTKRRYIEVELPSGGKARLQSLSELERAEYNSSLLDKKGDIDKSKLTFGTMLLLCRMLVDGEDKRLFLDHEYELLASIDSLDMEVLGEEARKHVGFDLEYRKELRKKSEQAQD